MITSSPTVSRDVFEGGTGWQLKTEGACKGDVCIPIDTPLGPQVDLETITGRIGLALVIDRERGLWSVGPETEAHAAAVTTAEAPPLKLPAWGGDSFDLASLRGMKVVLLAWAPY